VRSVRPPRSATVRKTPGKKRLREIDRRVRFLRKRLEQLQVVSERPADTHKVYFGAWVELEDEAGVLSRFRIVGADELDVRRGHISIDSPLARALLGKEQDAEVRVPTPQGEKTFYLTAIEYL